MRDSSYNAYVRERQKRPYVHIICTAVLLVLQAGFKHNPNSFRSQCPRRFREIDPNILHTCLPSLLQLVFLGGVPPDICVLVFFSIFGPKGIHHCFLPRDSAARVSGRGPGGCGLAAVAVCVADESLPDAACCGKPYILVLANLRYQPLFATPCPEQTEAQIAQGLCQTRVELFFYETTLLYTK